MAAPWVPMCFGARCQAGSVSCQACPCKVTCASVCGGPVPGEPPATATLTPTMDSAAAQIAMAYSRTDGLEAVSSEEARRRENRRLEELWKVPPSIGTTKE